MDRKRRQRRRRITPKLGYPSSQERIYTKELIKIVDACSLLVERHILPEIQGNSHSTLDQRLLFDKSIFLIILSKIALIRKIFAKRYKTNRVVKISAKVGESVSRFNKKQVKTTMKKSIGIDLNTIEPWAKDDIRSFVKENVSLIGSISNKYFDDLETMLLREIRAGSTIESITNKILEFPDITKKRAKLIAADQVSKFNASLTKKRHESLGITEYIWRTSKDERVRTEHKAREGQVYRYDKPPKDGNPGQPIRCRCWAEPIINL